MGSGRAFRNRRWRRRRAALTAVLKRVNKWLWPATALWCWIHFVSFIFFRHDLLAVPERVISLKLFELLVSCGFSPSNPRLYPLLLRIFWLLVLTRCRAITLLGFVIYVVFAPLAVAFTIFMYLLRRIKKLPKPVVQPVVLTPEQKQFSKSASNSSAALVCGIALWFLLYGRTASKGPLLLGLALTGLLFVVRLYRTTLRVALAEIDDSGLIARLSYSPQGYLLTVIRQILSGRYRTDEQFFRAARVHM